MNRIENTLSIPDRSIQTWLTIPSNIFDALSAFPKDMKGIVKYTFGEIKNIFKSAVTKWKRYQKVWNTLLSPFVALWTAVEWAVRTVVTPTVNLFANTLKTWANTVDNTRKSTFWSVLSDRPVSDFEYEELKTANVINKNKNWFSKWRFGRKVFKNSSKQPSWIENNHKKTQDKNNRSNVKSDSWMRENRERNINPFWQWSESIDPNGKHIWVAEAKRILSDSPCGRIIIDRLCESHKDFWIIFDNTKSIGRCNENSITIWTKMPSWITALAPFNWKTKNPELQKKHLLLHELSHWVIHSHKQDIPGIQEWLDLIKQYIEARKNIDWRTLSLLSYRNNIYETTWEKAREDFVEMLALRMNWNWNLCKKYLNLLSDEGHRKLRESYWLATITKEHASKLQNIFDSIVRYYG